MAFTKDDLPEWILKQLPDPNDSKIFVNGRNENIIYSYLAHRTTLPPSKLLLNPTQYQNLYSNDETNKLLKNVTDQIKSDASETPL